MTRQSSFFSLSSHSSATSPKPRATKVLCKLAVGLLSLLVLLVGLLPASIGQAATQAGSVDPTFASGSGPNSTVNTLAVQSDGKILVGGNFSTYKDKFSPRLVRLNPNGSLDSSFNIGSGANGVVSSIAVQSDGKILVGGNFTNYNGTAITRTARLNTDGSLDTSFNPGSGSDNAVNSVVVQSDGKILVGGNFTNYNGVGRSRIARLNNDGSLDTSFNPGSGASSDVLNMVVQSDGKIIIGGQFISYNGVGRNRIARLNPDGSLDTSFNPGTGATGAVYGLALQSDGKAIISGAFVTYNGVARNRIARLNEDGSSDPGFNIGSGANTGGMFSVALQSDGKIIIGGQFTFYSGVARNRVARLNNDGTLDTSFNPGTGAANGDVLSVAAQSDGKAIISGAFTTYNGAGANRIARLNSDGSLDTPFNSGTGADNTVRSLAVQSDGKTLVGGDFISYNGTPINRIARLNTDGSLDASFNPGTGADNTVISIVVLSDGKILIAGIFTNYNGVTNNRIARLNSDGSLDTSFNSGGSGANFDVWSIAVQNDGKIIIVGSFTSYNGTARSRVARLNSDGTLDASFNPGTGSDGSTVIKVAMQSDGKIIIGGGFTSFNGTARGRIARLNPDGSLDASFNIGTGANSFVWSLAMQSDDKIIIGGDFTSFNGTARNFIARLNSDGSLDSSFNVGSGADNRVSSIAVQSDSKVLIGGFFTSYNSTPGNRIARLNTDGSLDASFNVGSGANNAIQSIAVQSDSKIIIGGQFTSIDTWTRDKIARLEGVSGFPSTTTLGSSLNPSQFGQNITFTATTSPITATGTVQFTFGGSTTVTATLASGVATYVTSTLPIGDTPVTATYSGDANIFPSASQPYTQTVVTACNPQIVTNPNDDGTGSTCSTFSHALASTTSGTISFALSTGNTITFTGSLTPALKSGVSLDGGVNGIVLNGNGVAGDGLRLGGNNTLTNLTIRNFGGRELIVTISSAANQLFKIKVQN